MQFTDAKSDAHKLAREAETTTTLASLWQRFTSVLWMLPAPTRMRFNLAEWKGNTTTTTRRRRRHKYTQPFDPAKATTTRNSEGMNKTLAKQQPETNTCCAAIETGEKERREIAQTNPLLVSLLCWEFFLQTSRGRIHDTIRRLFKKEKKAGK